MNPLTCSSTTQSPQNDLDFTYADCDAHCIEIAELYSYSENFEFLLNLKSFEELMSEFNFSNQWLEMNPNERKRVVEMLLDYIELSDREKRFKAIKAILYLVQGVFYECSTKDQVMWSHENVFLLYEKGVFQSFVQILCMEIDSSLNQASQNTASNASNSSNLRTILNVLYTFVEVISTNSFNDTDRKKKLREQFREELSYPLPGSEELFAITMFQMTTKFCNGSAPHFPIKKILLLLWKTLLFTLGGMEKLKQLKNFYRSSVNLPPVPDDTIAVARTMRPASPPITAQETEEAQQQRKINRIFKRQKDFDEDGLEVNQNDKMNELNDFNELNELRGDSNGPSMFEAASEPREDYKTREIIQENPNINSNLQSNQINFEMEMRPASSLSSASTTSLNLSQINNFIASEDPILHRGLPWTPKVHYKDIDLFLCQTRKKFVGFNLPENRITTAGLPEPILESLKILKKHLYVSLSELQIKREEELEKYPLTFKEIDTQSLSSPAERLYEAMLPILPQYMIALLKILLTASPNSNIKTESINVLADVLIEESPKSIFHSLKVSIDIKRHKDIIIKAVSAILLLLLKHYKINHIYQFEYINQQLMFANCIPLILKFFSQNLSQYVTSQNSDSMFEFPNCVSVCKNKGCDSPLNKPTYCWRNMFLCINLVRILNKLTKSKNSRIAMLVVFKSAPILKKALKVRHAMHQLYILKLLKMQAKYLGRQWRKSNMKTFSAIYQIVRHRLTDDWAFANEPEAKPWNFQNEEFHLQANINRFHNRRYGKLFSSIYNIPSDHPASSISNSLGSSLASLFEIKPSNQHMNILKPIDNNCLSVLSKDIELTKEFKYNYESWLQREVFQCKIDWDQLLIQTDTSDM